MCVFLESAFALDAFLRAGDVADGYCFDENGNVVQSWPPHLHEARALSEHRMRPSLLPAIFLHGFFGKRNDITCQNERC